MNIAVEHVRSAAPLQADAVPQDQHFIRAASFLSTSDNSTWDEATRSIECTLCTEAAVPMYDWRSQRMFDEVLLADGGEMPDQLPLLGNHSHYSSFSVHGSARSIRRDGNQWNGRVHFAEGIEESERLAKLAKQGHLRDVSLGYRYMPTDAVVIPPGRTSDVRGRTFTASQEREMRVVVRWSGRELSTTPIGADAASKMRSAIDSKLIQPESVRHNSPESNLSSGSQSEPGRTMSTATPNTTPATDSAETVPATVPNVDSARSSTVPAALPPVAPAASQPAPVATVEQTRAEILANIRHANSFQGQVRSELITQAINEGWNQQTINERFLTSLTAGRTDPVPDGAPAVHMADNHISRSDVMAALLQRSGVSLQSEMWNTPYGQARFGGRSGTNLSIFIDGARTLNSSGNLNREQEKAYNFRRALPKRIHDDVLQNGTGSSR